jgi:cell division transport system permease protein
VKRVLCVIGVLLRTAARGLQGSLATTGVAIFTIAAALVLVGAFALLVGNMQGLLDRFGEQVQISAFLAPGLDPETQDDVRARAEKLSGVESATLISSDAALERFRESAGGAHLLEGLDENPLPASIEITVSEGRREPAALAAIALAVSQLTGVEELSHGQEWVEGYSRAASLVRTSAYVMGGVLGMAALLIVANTIRLAIYSREDELEILSLVGASRSFVRIPFLLEGTAQGAIGGAIAVALLYLGFVLFFPQVEYGLELFIGKASPRFFAVLEAAWLIIGGAALGMLGSALALFGRRV